MRTFPLDILKISMEGGVEGNGGHRTEEAATSEGPAAADSALRAGHPQHHPDLPILRGLAPPVLYLAQAVPRTRARGAEEPQVRIAQAPSRHAAAHRGPHPARPGRAAVRAAPDLPLPPTLPSGVCLGPDALH